MSFACKRKLFGSAALLSVLALSAAAATAGVVGTRSPDDLANGFGRAGGNAYWIDQQPASLPAPVVKAYNATKQAVSDAYNDVKAAVTTPPSNSSSEAGHAPSSGQ